MYERGEKVFIGRQKAGLTCKKKLLWKISQCPHYVYLTYSGINPKSSPLTNT